MHRQFGLGEVCDILDVSYRQLDYWIRTDLLSPSIRQASGSGTRRLLDYGDVVLLAVTLELRGSGYKLDVARSVIRQIESKIRCADLDNSVLVFTYRANWCEARIVDPADLTAAVNEQRALLVMLPLAPIVGRIKVTVEAIELLQEASNA